MSMRWLYKVVAVDVKMFGNKFTERTQAELDKLGAQGWELVAVEQAGMADSLRMFLKKPA